MTLPSMYTSCESYGWPSLNGGAFCRGSHLRRNEGEAEVACQRLGFDDARERFIQPKTAQGLDKLFHDHCGNYDRLKLSIVAERRGGLLQRIDSHFKGYESVEVPRGATITYHADESLSCEGCNWTKKSK